jgi:hypothetical protein
MINRDIQDIERGMSQDTSRCFLELQEREIEDDEFTRFDQYRNYSVNNDEQLNAMHKHTTNWDTHRWV